jgi:ketosteroid isomerase-like protein
MNFKVGFAVALLVAGGCAGGSFSGREAGRIERVLRDQDSAWNRGDIDGFMKGYWPSEKLTFSTGGKVISGWQPTRDRYRTKYHNRAAMGTLTFNDLDIKLLGRRHALVLGRWHLEREEPAGGAFSLVMKKIHGNWLIIHDHTSSDEP